MNTINPEGGRSEPLAKPNVTGSTSSSTSGGTGKDKTGKNELRQDADHLKDKAASKATEKTNQAASKAASAAKSTSAALRDAGDTLEQDSDTPNWLAGAFKQAATGIADLADTVESKEPQEMMRDVSGFARSNPTGFLAGAALAGFVAARFMKAGLDQSDATLGDIDPALSSSSGGTSSSTRESPATQSSFGTSKTTTTAAPTTAVSPTTGVS